MLGFRGAGTVLGEFSAIDGEEHSATVTVVDEVEALTVPAARFVEALEAEPGLALVLLRSIIGRLRDAERKRAEFVSLDVVGRVAQRLLELAEAYGEPAEGGGVRIGLVLSQRELAGWVGFVARGGQQGPGPVAAPRADRGRAPSPRRARPGGPARTGKLRAGRLSAGSWPRRPRGTNPSRPNSVRPDSDPR